MRIGIYGLTGDPLHNQHLAGPEQARTQLQLDFILYVTSGQPVDKPNATDKETRHAIVEAGVAGNPHFIPCRIEVDRDGPSYMVDTLCAVRHKYGQQHEYFIIVGEDRARTISTWREPERIARIAQFVIIPRGSDVLDRDTITAALPAGADIHLVNFEWSSSFVRKAIAEGRSVRYLLPPKVAAVIEERQLYNKGDVNLNNDSDTGDPEEKSGLRIASATVHIMFLALMFSVFAVSGPVALLFLIPYALCLHSLKTYHQNRSQR